MQLRRRVSLNDVQLDEIDSRIIVRGVEEDAAKLSFTTATAYGAPGQRLTSRHRDTLDVTVKFAIRITRKDMAARSELFEKIAGWAAGGGWLKLNYRPNRRLRVVCAGLPAAGDQADWDTEYEITFRAYEAPYWEQSTPSTMTINSTKSLSRSMEIAGTMDSVLDVTFENISGMEISTMTITTDVSRFEFKSLGLKADETLVISHTAAGLLRIRIRGASGDYRSVMSRRTPESSDDLVVSPGLATIGLTAQRAGKVTLSCNGRYA